MALAIPRDKVRQYILNAAVRNAHEFGFLHCTTESILKDEVYRQFFRKMLEDDENQTRNQDVEAVKAELLKEIE